MLIPDGLAAAAAAANNIGATPMLTVHSAAGESGGGSGWFRRLEARTGTLVAIDVL